MKISHGIQAKFLSIFIPAILICFIGFFSIYEWLIYKESLRQLHVDLKQTVIDQTIALSKSVANHRMDEINATVTSMISHSNIVGITILGMDNKILAQSGITDTSTACLLEQGPIYGNAVSRLRRVGSLSICSSDKVIMQQAKKRIVYLSIFALSLLIISVFSAYLAQYKSVTKPINRLLHSITFRKKSNIFVPVMWNSNDEIGILINEYNDLQQILSAQQFQQEQQQNMLEKSVKLRTFELNQANSELQKKIIEHRRLSETLQLSNWILIFSNKAQAKLTHNNSHTFIAVLEETLSEIIHFTQSEAAFIVETLEAGIQSPRLKILATAFNNDASDKWQSFQNNYSGNESKINSLQNMLVDILRTQTPFISNDFQVDSQRCIDFPEDLSHLDSFMGIPIMSEREMIGIIGLANRKDGYSKELLNELTPLITALYTMIASARNIKRKNEAELALLSSKEFLSRQQSSLIELTRYVIYSNSDTSNIFKKVCEECAALLNINRVSIWRYSDGQPIITSINAYDADENTHTQNQHEDLGEFPDYYNALSSGETLIINDTSNHPAVQELADQYLIPNKIYSMLDMPIMVGEEIHGILCFHIVNRKHNWMPEEQLYARAVTGLITLAIERQERVQIEQKLRQSHKMEAIGRLAGGIAHDFNNILTAIIGFNEIIADTISDTPIESKIASEVQEVHDAANRAAKLTDQLLAFSRQQILDSITLNLNTVINNVTKLLRRLLPEHIKLKLELDSDLFNINADPGQIEQILLNLTINSRDAMPDGGSLTISTQNCQVDYELNEKYSELTCDNYVLMKVTDTGVGLSKESISNIFEPFYTTKERGQGTGLGLATVYGIVEQSNGHIYVESDIDKSTSMLIYFPTTEKPITDKVIHNIHRETRHNNETVLVAEDEDAVRTLIKRTLTAKGYNVLEAKSGFQAIEIAKKYKQKIDLLITDVIMPEINGHVVIEQLQLIYPGIKSLYISGYTGDILKKENLSIQENNFLQKPFKPSDIINKIRSIIDA
jgi:signal transduction histidine kinase